MNFAADCLAVTGLDGTQLGIGFAVALGAIAVGVAVFGRGGRNRVALALAPLLILAGIGGLALTSSTPANATTGCEAPMLQPITYGNYNGETPYVPNAFLYPTLDPYTVYLPGCFWYSESIEPVFEQQITAVGDGTITYSATGLTTPDAMSPEGLVAFHPTTFAFNPAGASITFDVTATNEFGAETKTYTAVSSTCVG